MSLESDCLMGVVGLLPDGVSRRDHAAAASMPSTFADRAEQWWDAERKAFRQQASPNLDKLLDALAEVPTVADVKGWLDSTEEDDVVMDVHASILSTRKYLLDKWPRITIDTFAGPRLLPPGHDDAAEIASLWAVLDDPQRVLDEMDMGSLSPSQADAFRANYPSLYGHYAAAFRLTAAKRAAKDPDWFPGESQEILLGILSGQPPGMLAPAAPVPTGELPKQQKDLGASAAATQADVSSKPRTAVK